MLPDQTSGAGCDPGIQLFQSCPKIFREPSTGRPLCLHPVHQRISQEIRLNAKLPAVQNLAINSARRVQSPNSITPSMKTSTAECILLD
jgi:hypothetical protein